MIPFRSACHHLRQYYPHHEIIVTHRARGCYATPISRVGHMDSKHKFFAKTHSTT